jgi:inorganic pyrophosphatase
MAGQRQRTLEAIRWFTQPQSLLFTMMTKPLYKALMTEKLEILKKIKPNYFKGSDRAERLYQECFNRMKQTHLATN